MKISEIEEIVDSWLRDNDFGKDVIESKGKIILLVAAVLDMSRLRNKTGPDFSRASHYS